MKRNLDNLHKHPLYVTWSDMKSRCTNPNNRAYHRYGGRGITVCERWASRFKNFLDDMGEKPSPQHSLDRIDNNKGYFPENCKWSTRLEQQRNMDKVHKYTIDGILIMPCVESKKLGLKTDTIINRIKKGLPLHDILSKKSYFVPSWPKKAIETRIANSKARTHCKNGHEFTEENSYISKEGWRSCRKCHNIRQIAANKKNRLKCFLAP